MQVQCNPTQSVLKNIPHKFQIKVKVRGLQMVNIAEMMTRRKHESMTVLNIEQCNNDLTYLM